MLNNVGVFNSLRRLLQKFQQRRARKRVLALIHRSGLFDAAWYLAENPDVAKAGIDPATHYLIHGWLEGRNPSPLFDGQEYLSRHPECLVSGVNPLAHHLDAKCGGRQVPNLSRPHEAADSADVLAAKVEIPNRPRSWCRESADSAAAGRQLYRVGDSVLGYGVAETKVVDDLHRHVHCLLRLGRHERYDIVAVVNGQHPVPEARRGEAAPAAADILRFSAVGAPRFDDAWFVNRHCLRLRLSADGGNAQAGVVTALQWASVDQTPCLSEAAIGPAGVDFIDAQLVNPFLPLLLVLTTPDGDLRASTMVPFPSLCRGGLHHAETLVEPSGTSSLEAVRLASARLLAGWNAAEGAASLDWIEIDLFRATGAERLFATDLRDWLRDVLGIGIRSFDHGPRIEQPGSSWLRESIKQAPRRSPAVPNSATGERSTTSRLLRLSSDAVPSLHAIFGLIRPDEGLAAFILCRGSDGMPSWIVTPPKKDFLLDESQPGLFAPFPRLVGPAHDTSIPSGSSMPAALRFTRSIRRHAAELQAPFSPETPVERILPGAFSKSPRHTRVTAVLPHASDEILCAAKLEALSLQIGVLWDQILLITDAADHLAATSALDSLFPHCGTVLTYGPETPLHARFNQAAALARGEMLLILGGAVLLHDRRTVACLASLATRPHVASAACMLIAGGAGTKSEQIDVIGCGCHASAPVKDRTNFSNLRLPDSLASLPSATWPVAANTTACFLVRQRAWADLGGFEPVPGDADSLSTRYWEAAVARGHQHLVTTAVSATVVDADSLSDTTSQPTSKSSELAMTARRIVA